MSDKGVCKIASLKYRNMHFLPLNRVFFLENLNKSNTNQTHTICVNEAHPIGMTLCIYMVHLPFLCRVAWREGTSWWSLSAHGWPGHRSGRPVVGGEACHLPLGQPQTYVPFILILQSKVPGNLPVGL